MEGLKNLNESKLDDYSFIASKYSGGKNAPLTQEELSLLKDNFKYVIP